MLDPGKALRDSVSQVWPYVLIVITCLVASTAVVAMVFRLAEK